MPERHFLACALIAWCFLCGCGGEVESGQRDGAPVDAALPDGGAPGDAATARDGVASPDGAANPDGASPPAPAACTPLPAPTGTVVEVHPTEAGSLRDIVLGAASGTTILLHDGTYDLGGGDAADQLTFREIGVTLRSYSGDRDAVVLDGAYVTGEIVAIAASDVTIADLTIARPYYHAIHVTGRADADISGVVIHNVHVRDPGQQGIKVNPSTELHYADHGRIECSLIELTDAGRPNIRDNCYTGGIDAHAAWGWEIRLNTIRGFWCEAGLSEHGIHLWRTSRDTLVERNRIEDCARGIGFGLGDSGTGTDRVYPDNPYPGAGYLGHIDGIIRNNFVFAAIAGFDSGITLDQARGAQVYHNTVVSLEAPFSSIEWRFANTDVTISNNLVSHSLVPRDGATAALAGNLEQAPLASFVDGSSGNLHLDPQAAAVDQGVALAPGLCDDDIDGDPRTGPRDVGADEVP